MHLAVTVLVLTSSAAPLSSAQHHKHARLNNGGGLEELDSASVSSGTPKCSRCGRDGPHDYNCCHPGGAWAGVCGDEGMVARGAANFTYVQGFVVCQERLKWTKDGQHKQKEKKPRSTTARINVSLGHSSSAQLSRRSPVQHRLPLVYSLTKLRGKSINRQGCGVLHRDLNSSICASVADVLVGPPVKCLISDCLVNRIEASSRRCKKEWWEVKKRTQRIFAIETDYVRVRAFCFVHASGGVSGIGWKGGKTIYGGGGGATAPAKDGGMHPPDPYFVAIPYGAGGNPMGLPAYANGNVQEAVNALLARSRHQGSSAFLTGFPRGGDVEKNDMSKLRAALLAACQSEPSCEWHQPVPAWPNAPSEIYATVDYCLMPPGDSATRAGWFNALSGLCVPVFFSSCLPLTNRSLVYDSMYAPILPFTHRVTFGAGVWSVVLDANRTLENGKYVFDALRAVDAKAMRETIATFVHRLQWDHVHKYISERTVE